jgi:hypothetical protein
VSRSSRISRSRFVRGRYASRTFSSSDTPFMLPPLRRHAERSRRRVAAVSLDE